MVVQHNISAMTANRYYGINNSSLGKSLEKLSSGYAINRAGDNAAGLAVSEKMRAQIQGLTQASKNAQDGISMVQTYEGALQETDSILQRMRTIAVQSANGSYQNDVDRDALQLEFDQLNDELNQIADTDFNGVVVLNGGVMADGTVANDTSKVADRPAVDNISTTPNAAFTYKSTVNGTVDSGGNGSLSINGVTLKLKNGEGSASLGSASSGGITEYSTGTGDDKITVTDGKVNGKINAKETFKIDDQTNTIEIHGNSYTVSGGKLLDSNGNNKGSIDGLLVTVSSGNNVTLEGVYSVENSVVKTGSAFSSNNGVSGIVDAAGDGKAVFNNTKFDLNGGAATVDDANYSSEISYTAANVKLTNGVVGGTITASGASENGVVDNDVAVTDVTASKWDSTKLAATFTGLNSTQLAGVTIYEAKINDTTLYSTDGTAWYDTINSGASAPADVVQDAHKVQGWKNDGTIQLGATADNTTLITKLDASSGAIGTDGSVTGVKLSNKQFTIAGETFKLNQAATAFADGTTASKSITGLNGVKVKFDGTVDSANSITTISTAGGSTKNVGSFKVSTGVSTSDTFNHGTANLTFADNMTLQVGARSKDAVTFNFSYTTNGIGNLKADLNASARGLGTDQVSVKNQEDANAAIDAIDNAINKVSMIRGTFGAIQNRLEHKINNIDTNQENLTAAESRIRDTQMDQEMMKFTSSQILSQASQSMLAQANSLPQGVLQLLG